MVYASTGSDGLATGDFDGDGRLDLVKTAYAASRVYTLRGNGDGTFAAPVQRATVSGAGLPIVGRLNGDATDDLLVPMGSGAAVSLLATPNTGAMTALPYFPTAGYPSKLADLNADGNLDLLVQGDFNKLVTIRGTGNGAFGASNAYPLGYALSPTAGDFNGDGKLDVLAGSAGGEAHLFTGDGAGGLAHAGFITLTYFAYARNFALADFNRDGKLDFAAADFGSLRSVTGNGNGTFTLVGLVEGLGNVDDLAAADFDLDGKFDLLALDRDGQRVGLLRGLGDGNFAPTEFTPLNSPSGDWTRYLVCRDFNGDGFTDAATLGDSGRINVLINTAVPEPAALALAGPAMLLLSPRSIRKLRCASLPA